MAKKTKFKIEVSFHDKVPVRYVASGILQRGKPANQKTLGTTKPHADTPEPVLVWEESKSGNSVTLATKEVSAQIVYSAEVLIDKAIDKKSACYKHVVIHENAHIQFWRDGVPKYKQSIIDMVKSAVSSQMDKPEKVPPNRVKSFKADAASKVHDALRGAARKYGDKINAESLAIHTKDEMVETNSVCAAYL